MLFLAAKDFDVRSAFSSKGRFSRDRLLIYSSTSSSEISIEYIANLLRSFLTTFLKKDYFVRRSPSSNWVYEHLAF